MASLQARKSKVILLDGPQRGLDARMSRLIKEERQRWAIQILICYDMVFVPHHADDVLALHEAGIGVGRCSFFFCSC